MLCRLCQYKAIVQWSEFFKRSRHADSVVRALPALVTRLGAFLFLVVSLTYTLPVHGQSETASEKQALADLPFAITSFGAAHVGRQLYVYGGNMGDAHSYSADGQSNQLLCLDLDSPTAGWKSIAEGPRLQGLAMVAHGTKVIRIGGFSARNEAGKEADLHSSDSVAAFDTAQRKWTDMPPLPEPRSSHDATILGNLVIVAGGWALDGKNESKWHNTAWAMDLSAQPLKWRSIATPTFTRRALALVSHGGKAYVIGGMNQSGGPTKEVAIYDPVADQWSSGPAVIGQKSMAGFGAAAVELDGQLIVGTIEGQLMRLSQDGKEWQKLDNTRDARFFHRLLPAGPQTLLAIGGANMESGKFLAIEKISLAK